MSEISFGMSLVLPACPQELRKRKPWLSLLSLGHLHPVQ